VSTMSATFELERFAWDDGAFEVAGRWKADDDRSLGRTRLIIEIDGRRRRIGAYGGKQASAGEWTARFGHQRRPDRVGPAELEVGGDLVIDLPKPELPPAPPPAPAGPPPELRGAEALLDQLRSERAQTEAAARRLKEEREAAEAASRRLAEERASAESAAKAAREAAEAAKQAKPPPPPPAPEPAPRPAFHHDSPRRAEIREALARPGGPRHVLPTEQPAHRRELAYALAALIVILIVLLVVLLL